MKLSFAAWLAVGAAALGGCRGLGYNDQSAYGDLTPNVNEKQYVRTYPNGEQAPATVTEQKPNPSNDPAYPK